MDSKYETEYPNSQAVDVPDWVAAPERIAKAANYLLRDTVHDQWHIRIGSHSCCVASEIGFAYIDTIIRNHRGDSKLTSQTVSNLIGGITLTESEDDDPLILATSAKRHSSLRLARSIPPL